jgi:hypothetical protein
MRVQSLVTSQASPNTTGAVRPEVAPTTVTMLQQGKHMMQRFSNKACKWLVVDVHEYGMSQASPNTTGAVRPEVAPTTVTMLQQRQDKRPR